MEQLTESEKGRSNHFFGMQTEDEFDRRCLELGIVSKKVNRKLVWDRDIIVGDRVVKVQIKAVRTLTKYKRRDKSNKLRYVVPGIRSNENPETYASCGVDFIAIYVQPQNRWFILPASEGRSNRIKISQNPEGKMARALECWSHLVSQPSTVTLQSG